MARSAVQATDSCVAYGQPDPRRRASDDCDSLLLGGHVSDCARGGFRIAGPTRGRASSRPRPRPRGARFAQIPVRADLARRRAQVTPEVLDRRATPEPVGVVDAVNDQSRLEHERVRDHRVAVGVRVLLDVEVLLDRPPGIGEESPLGASKGRNFGSSWCSSVAIVTIWGVRPRDLRGERRQLEALYSRVNRRWRRSAPNHPRRTPRRAGAGAHRR
jgi:hypothetical protein